MIALIAMDAYPVLWRDMVASLTIRGLDETLKTRLRLEAARRGCSMEETARQILRQALLVPESEAGGHGTRIHQYFVDAGVFDLELPERSEPRPAPDFSGERE
jgi:plasmid stability protein